MFVPQAGAVVDIIADILVMLEACCCCGCCHVACLTPSFLAATSCLAVSCTRALQTRTKTKTCVASLPARRMLLLAHLRLIPLGALTELVVQRATSLAYGLASACGGAQSFLLGMRELHVLC